jgi:CheY-like chemotaxis protein
VYFANSEPQLMTPTPAPDSATRILVAEDDVLVRIAIADYLRNCGFRVIEAAGGREARTVLEDGPTIHVLLADARLAGDDNGFALAQWARRHRPHMTVILSVSLDQKSEAAASLCSDGKIAPPSSRMHDRISSMRQRTTGGGGHGATGYANRRRG